MADQNVQEEIQPEPEQQVNPLIELPIQEELHPHGALQIPPPPSGASLSVSSRGSSSSSSSARPPQQPPREQYIVLVLMWWLVAHLWTLSRGLVTIARHGFGAMLGALQRNRTLRTYSIVTFLLLLLLGPGVQSAFWEKRRAYKMGEEDVENCPPGYRMNRASFSRWGWFAPNCVQIGTTGDVWFPEDLTISIVRAALEAKLTKIGNLYWHWMQWLLSYLIAKSDEGAAKEELRAQLAEVKEHTTKATAAIQQKVEQTGLDVAQATQLVAVETQAANEDGMQQMAARIEDLISETLENLGDPTGFLIKAYEKEAAETMAEEQIQENRRQRKQRRDCERQVTKLRKQLSECKKSKACKEPTPDPEYEKWKQSKGTEGRPLENLLVDMILAVKAFCQHWFSPSKWWQFVKKMPAVWIIFKKMVAVGAWVMALAWWQLLILLLLGGNVLVLILNLLLSAFRIVDNTISLTARLGLLVRAIITLMFSLLSYLARGWWIITKNSVLALYYMGRQPRGPDDGRQPRNQRGRRPPHQGRRNDHGDDDDYPGGGGFGYARPRSLSTENGRIKLKSELQGCLNITVNV